MRNDKSSVQADREICHWSFLICHWFAVRRFCCGLLSMKGFFNISQIVARPIPQARYFGKFSNSIALTVSLPTRYLREFWPRIAVFGTREPGSGQFPGGGPLSTLLV